jgi:hypothetical protein
MTCRIKQLLSISLFALGIFYSNAAQAQSCTPTLYLFRHAEDVDHDKPPPDQPTGLTAVGRTHANLYPMMINQLETVLGAQSPCPLQRVFAMWDRKVGTEVRGTPNPYQTALLLAQYVGEMLIPPMPYVPEMYFTDSSHTYYLCEYPSDSNCQTTPSFDCNALAKYGQDVNSHLYSY